MKKLLIIILSVILCIANINAQSKDASWLHNELWEKWEDDPVWGRVYSIKCYFTEKGEFYYGLETHKEAKALSGIQIRTYSGTYDYNPTEEKMSLYPTEINGIDTLGLEFNLRGKEIQWTTLREKWDYTFAMYANPIIFKIKTMKIGSSYSEEGRLDLKDESNIDVSDLRKILDILKHAKYSGTVDELNEWMAKADAIVMLANGDKEFARVFIRKGEPSVCIDAYGWLTVTTLQYELSEADLKKIIEIVENYI